MESIPPPNFLEPAQPRASVTPDGPTSPPHGTGPDEVAAASGLGQPRKRRLDRRGVGGIGAAILAFAAKAKVVLLALVHFKFLISAGTMAVSIAAYASIWGWTFAVGFVALLFIHEMGHVVAVKQEGGKASLPYFIPFAGAMIAAKSFGGNAAAEARIGLAGPIFGTIGSAVCFLLWKQTGDQFWQALAYWGFFLNLINLIPVLPLDGGRAMAAMTPLMWIVGYLVLVAVVLSVALNPLFALFLVLGAVETYRRWKQWRSGDVTAQSYYRVPANDRLLIAITYVVLAGVLALGLHATYFHASFA